jgi:hypothetical protein
MHVQVFLQGSLAIFKAAKIGADLPPFSCQVKVIFGCIDFHRRNPFHSFCFHRMHEGDKLYRIEWRREHGRTSAGRDDRDGNGL